MMNTFAAKLGALFLTPFLFFGGQGQLIHAPDVNASSTGKTSAGYVDSQNWNSTNNGYHWGTSSKAPLSIANVTGPTALQVNQSGTWTVGVSGTATGTLSYSVTWGDEGVQPLAMAAAQTLQATSTFTHTYASAGSYSPVFTVTDSNGDTVSKTAETVVVSAASVAPQITSLSQTSGAVGATVTINGSNFVSSSTVTIDGKTASSTYNGDGKLSFMVPSLANGTYNVRVHTGDQKSNAIAFTVTAASPAISIEGLDAPVTLTVNQSGTWTVNVATNDSNLHYSVTWGDENLGSRLMMAFAPAVQASSTFTHSYSKAGTYTPTFTVSDDSGHTQTVSATVKVTK